MSAPAGVMKTCCKCGLNLSGIKRMKDHSGHYWCVPCGQRDQARKAMSTGPVCASCGTATDPGRITMVKGLPYCNFCLARRGKKAGGGGFSLPSFSLPSFPLASLFSNSGGVDRSRMYKMIGVIALLAIIRVVLHFL